MRFRYYTCDVFTDVRFGGNPLAVLPEADGLTADQMQRIAREFDYSETTFVLPAEQGHDCRVRIFTPSREVPFAGHPNIGTAFVLASVGTLRAGPWPRVIVFEQDAGPVPVRVESGPGGRLWCELRAPEPFTRAAQVAVAPVAGALGLRAADIVTETHAPVVASVGLPFLIVEVSDLGALARAQADPRRLSQLAVPGLAVPDVHVYTALDHEGSDAAGVAGADSCAEPDIRARMFAPLDGVAEDPATGSANAALAGLLADCDPAVDGDFSWRISQGVEMGRPSMLHARARKFSGHVSDVHIGGEALIVMAGEIEV